jgi:[acyl-carrier-protein] S-malonyltransferase
MSKHSFVGAGHSLGEYSALCAAGFFDFEQGLEIVRARGSFLQTASEKNPGAMAAVLGLSKEKVLELCSKASSKGVCEAVNFNCPGQIVVSGAVAAIENFMDLAREAGAAKCVKLNVSGAFHSSLMKEAAVEMQEKLTKYTFNKPSFGVYTNYDAELTVDPDQLKEKLIKQVDHPVLWDMTIEKIIAAGFEIFIEVGPGKVLSGLLRKVDRSKKAYNVSDQDSLQEVVKLLA